MTLDRVLLPWVLLWFLAAAFVLYRHWKTHKGVGLLLAYVLIFGMLHWVAPLLYLLPWYDSSWRDITRDGTRLAAYAMVAFAAGTEVERWLPGRATPSAGSGPGERTTISTRAIRFYLITGIILYAIVAPFAGAIPSVTAIASTGSMLIVIALGLLCWNAWQRRRRRRFWAALMATCLLPAVTVAAQGFLGYGFAAMLSVFAFVASFFRPRWKFIALGVALSYLGLSVYVTYMRDREEIRHVVWRGADLDQRLARVWDTAATADWFNPMDGDHLTLVDGRLNQNHLLGASMRHLGERLVDFAEGRTLINAALGIVPRALWPDKPAAGGSGDLVAKYTGTNFAYGTSVGVGQVLELYINFGLWGVLPGFVIIGFVVVRMDRKAANALHRGDARYFTLWYLPGLSLLQIGGSFIEVTSTAAAGLVMATALRHLMGRRRTRRQSSTTAVVSTAT